MDSDHDDASQGRHVQAVDEQPATAIRKIVVKQKLEGKQFDPLELYRTLRSRKSSSKGREVTVVHSYSERMGFFVNSVPQNLKACARACTVLLSMCVTACAAERNWSRWSLTFAPNRNALGLDTAQKVVFIQMNDPKTRIVRGYDAYIG
jgi:hypothetical protein